MPPILGLHPFNITEHVKAQDQFHLALGRTLGEWAKIEDRLHNWFHYISGMTYETSKAVFYSARSFSARKEMLEAALSHAIFNPASALEFIKRATAKSGAYVAFRNRLAHGEPSFDVRDENSPTFKQVILLQGKHVPAIAADSAVTMTQLENALENYRELSRLLMDVFEVVNGTDPDIPEESLRLLAALPKAPESKRT
jgi:hypothetical protein